MHRRALLSSAAALSLAGLSGCLADARRTTSGRIRADTGHSKLHPADEQYVNGSFPDDADFRGWLFSDPPADQRDVFTDLPRRSLGGPIASASRSASSDLGRRPVAQYCGAVASHISHPRLPPVSTSEHSGLSSGVT